MGNDFTLFYETQRDDILGVVDHRGLVEQFFPWRRQLPDGFREQRIYDLGVRCFQPVPQHFLGEGRVQRFHISRRAYRVVQDGEVGRPAVGEVVVARLKYEGYSHIIII